MKSLLPILNISASLLSSFALLPLSVAAKKDEPTISSTTLKAPLQNTFYFDDSNVILGLDIDTSVVYRSDDAGETWKKINDDDQAGNSFDVWPHAWDNQRAYIIGIDETHWMTKDQGKTWKSFNGGTPALFRTEPLKFHGRDPQKVIWNAEDGAYYTTNDFADIRSLYSETRGCQWAVGTPMFGQDIASEVDDRVFCITRGLYGDYATDNRLLVSDDYFKKEKVEPALDSGRAVNGIISMAAVKKYIVAAAKSKGTKELALYVTDDSSQWHRAEFGQHKVEEDAYTILESTNYSMQVDVLGSRQSNAMGHLFTSNSNGTYFTKNIDYTNRNAAGRVDFEKVANKKGIVIVNIVDNPKDVKDVFTASKKIVSRISFDDGRTFEDLKVGGKALHLHSITEAKQGGRIFSSPAPGIVMGIGNTGKFLDDYENGNLYVSDDAGRTWSLALSGTHMYEFGNNGAILLAANTEEPTKVIKYSLNHGKDWKEAELDEKIRVQFVSTVPDSTTLKFLIMGTSKTDSEPEWAVIKLDFEGLHERTCSDKDFERWPARVDDKGKPSCVMGHKQFFRRRKANSECFIDADFKDPQPEFEPCTCTDEDFECDYNFVRDDEDESKCKPVTTLKVPDGECKKGGDTFKGPSGWRLIPGNECTRKNGVELDKEIDRPCTDTVKKPVSGKVEVTQNDFKASSFMTWHYFGRADRAQGDDETIVMLDGEQKIYISKDHGKAWTRILKGEPIVNFVPNPHFYDVMYFLTGSKKGQYTVTRGDTFEDFKTETPPSDSRGLSVLKFHPEHEQWLLWSGIEEKSDRTNFYYSKDRGYKWDMLARSASKCEYIDQKDKSGQLIFCAQHEKEDMSKSLQLVSSDNFFADTTVHFNSIIDFATMAEFIIVAAKTEDGKDLRVDASVDGHTFAEAKFPSNFQVEHQQAYTVLDSSTHAVFLHVTENPRHDQEHGTILKSNSNGTSYVLTLRAVNRDKYGFVDFEKMQGLEGVAMVNVVANTKEVDGGEIKKLKSMITHNDGSDWALLPPPLEDAVGNPYKCVETGDKATDKCSLHIHSYTERRDKSATFSSPSAIGLMMAVGNVGEFLGRKDSENTDTFITQDAGLTWKSVMKGPFMWEYGDQGSIIVIVPERVATRSVFYTLDEGKTWKEFEFSDDDMSIEDITTVPTDVSFQFLLWGRKTRSSGTISTVNLDFSQLTERERPCKIDDETPENEDYYLWSPKHPMQDDNCLFGHIARYHRKRPEAECYNGPRIERLHEKDTNCSCTRQDFECDYNFEKQPDGTCKLVEGLEPVTHELFCKENPEQTEFYEVTGYRRIPLSTCEGGRELDKGVVHPCPGHEKEFQEKHGISGIGLFFAIVIPFAAACGVGYWVWQQYKSYGFGNFGQIRLGDSFGGARSSSGGQSALIAIPVAIIAGAWAVVKAIPLLTSSLFRSAKGYVPVGSRNGYANGPYRSRDEFSRRQDYSSAAFVEDDELLGAEDELDGEDV